MKNFKVFCRCQSLVLFAGICVLLCMPQTRASADDEKSGDTSSSQGTSQRKAKKVYTNEDLKGLKNTTRVNQPTADQTKTGSRSSGIAGYRDKDGHDRQYWQKKAHSLNAQLETVDSQIAAEQAKYNRLNAASGVKVTHSGKLHASSSDTRVQVEKRIDDLKLKRAGLLKAKQDLEEEARKAQALPEWLR